MRFLGYLIVALVGCSVGRIPSYDVVLQNISSEKIRDAHVEFGTIKFPGGIVAAHTSSSVSEPRIKIPEEANVSWRTEDGILHSRTINIRKSELISADGMGFKLVFKLSGSEANLSIEDRGY